MICSEFLDLLDSYETLDEKQHTSLCNHAALCENCHKELEFFKSIIETSASIPYPAPPKTLIADINARLDREPVVLSRVARFKYNIRANSRGLATVAACLAVGVAVGLNSAYIKDRLQDDSTDGIIKETVTENAGNGSSTQVPAVINTAEPDIAKETAASQKTASVKKDEKPASSENKDASKNVRVNTDAVSVKETQKPAASTQKPETDDSDNRYEISEEYYVPQNEVAQATQTPDNEPDVNDYSIADGDIQIAYGYYNVPKRSVTTNSMSDYLFVESRDMGAVVSTMSEMGVRNAEGYYMTSRTNFYELMDRLNSQGVKYSCDLKYSSGDKISFKLIYD